MMHQIIIDPEQVAKVINNIKGDIYQIIPFRRFDTDLFLILYKYEDYPSTESIAYGRSKLEENQ